MSRGPNGEWMVSSTKLAAFLIFVCLFVLPVLADSLSR